jgi:hypothetical protein
MAKAIVFQWSHTNHSSFSPINWLSVNLGNGYNEGAALVENLKSRLPGKRGIFPYNLFADRINQMITTNPADLIINGLDINRERAFFLELFTKLKESKVTPERMIFDLETGFHFFNLNLATPDFINLLDEVRPYLPENLKRFTAADVWNWQADKTIIHEWDTFAHSKRREWLFKAVISTHYDVFKKYPRATNWGDSKTRIPVTYGNDWYFTDGVLTVSESNPHLYPTPNYHNGTKGYVWNSLIISLNWMRACMIRGKQLPVPWIPYPSYLGDYLPSDPTYTFWTELVKHSLAMGIPIFLFWNPITAGASTVEEAAYAHSIFSTIDVGTKLWDLPLIPFDAEEIITGAHRTTYADFKARLVPPINN